MVLTFGDVSRRREILHTVTFSMARQYLDYQTEMRNGEAPSRNTGCPEIGKKQCGGARTNMCKTCLGIG